jgi:hypothetical protein
MNATLSLALVAENIPLGQPFEVEVSFKTKPTSKATLDLYVIDSNRTVVATYRVEQSVQIQSHQLDALTKTGSYHVHVKHCGPDNDDTDSNTFHVGAATVVTSGGPLNNGFIPITKMVAQELADPTAAVNLPRPSKIRVVAFLNRRPASTYAMIARIHAVWNGSFTQGISNPLNDPASTVEGAYFALTLPNFAQGISTKSTTVNSTFDLPFTPSDYPNWKFVVSLEPADRTVTFGDVFIAQLS